MCDDISVMTITIISLLLSLVGLGLSFLGLRRLWRRKLISGSLQGLSGLLFMALALLAWALAANLYTYQRLTAETPIAHLRFEQLSPQLYRAYIIDPAQQANTYDLRGDEWQLDARVLKWHGIAALMGFNTGYRLDRLSGRYRDISQDRRAPRTVHSLHERTGLDIWSLANKYKRALPWVDAVYGSATYMPMTDKAEFDVTISSSGLITRPANEIARQATQQWQ